MGCRQNEAALGKMRLHQAGEAVLGGGVQRAGGLVQQPDRAFNGDEAGDRQPPALTFIGLIGAAIAVTLRRGGLLLAVIVLPLTVPVLIFGVAAANTAGPVPFGTPFTVLCALTLASLVIGPFAAAAALRQEME